MPPVRTMPTFKPVKTERTHEENQERAYIAASRRSDRSLEARVESARRASEIHKKRTGRSLRVREEDVMNEEMYEEEDDDLPMQYRRINALNPHLSYAFAERLNNYINGQIGVRTALQQAILQSNQYQQNQQMLNAQMQANPTFNSVTSPMGMNSVPQSPWPMNNMQPMRPDFHQRSATVATPQELANYQQGTSQAATSPLMMHHRSMSLSIPPGSSTAQPGSPNGLPVRKTSQSPTQAASSATAVQSKASPSSRPAAMHGSSFEAQIAPLTLQLPNETLQMLDGTGNFNPALFPPQFSAGQGSPSSVGKYSYNPNGRSRSSPTGGSYAPHQKASGFDGLNQTLTQGTMDPQNASFFPPSNPSGNFDPSFDAGSYESYNGLGEGNDFGFGPMGDFHKSGLASPSEAADATFGDFFDFQATPE